MFIVLPTLEEDLSNYGQIFNHASFAFVILCFCAASCKDPGVLKPDPSQHFLHLLNDINPADLCPECKVIRSARSRHCAICNQCVERFDHHCPWINNCVGIKNHNSFLMFLFSIWIKIIFHSYIDTWSLVRFILLDTSQFDCNDYDYCRQFCIYDLCSQKEVHIVACSVCILICLFYFLMSSALLFTHCKNYMANRTTNERFSKRTQKQAEPNKTNETSENPDESALTSSILTMSDFDNSSLIESVVDENSDKARKKKYKRNKRRGCCINCWKMATHTKIVPQNKLYNYLAEQSMILRDSEVVITNSRSKPSTSNGERSIEPLSHDNSQVFMKPE